MIPSDFPEISRQQKPLRNAAARCLVGRAVSVAAQALGDADSEMLGLVGHPVLCDMGPYQRGCQPVPVPTFDALQGPRIAETASRPRPAPIRFLANLPKTPERPAPKFNVARARVVAKQLRDKQEQFGRLPPVFDDEGQPVGVAEIWLEPFLTAF
jgi:hypothetical protein